MEKMQMMALQGRRNDQSGENLGDTLRRFSQSGRSWISSEAELAQAELAADGKRIAIIFALAGLVLGTGLAAIMLVTLFLVSTLAPYVGGLANASGILAVVFAILAAAAGWWAWKLAHAKLGIVSVLKRWTHVAKNVESET